MIEPRQVERKKSYQIYTEDEFEVPVKMSVGEYDSQLPPPVEEAVSRYFPYHLEQGCLQYPSDHSELSYDLISEICHYNSIYSSQCVLLTAGSTESLRLIFDTYIEESDRVLFPIPSYSNALNLVKLRSSCIDTPVCRSYSDICEILHHESSYKLVYLSLPNNPTGYIFSREQVRFLASQYPDILFVIDGCYLE